MERIFIYGSLQPGGPNEHVMTAIGGEWQPAVIRGDLVSSGWGAGIGYPGLVLNEAGDEIRGHVFTSSALAAKWSELDAFEGDEYERVVTTVTLETGEATQAHVYVLRTL